MTISERNEFVLQNKNFIYHLLKPWRDRHNGIFDYDDLVQVAFEQMIKCANTWNPEGSKFTTYAGISIVSQIKTFIRKNCSALTVGRTEYYNNDDLGYLNVISFDQQIDKDSDNTDEQSELIGTEDSLFNTIELIHTVRQICDKSFNQILSDRAYNTWLLRNIYGYTQRETAIMMNTSQASVSRYLKVINKKLKEVL